MGTNLRHPAMVLLIILSWSIPAFCSEIHEAAEAGDLATIKNMLKDNPDQVSSKDHVK